MKIVVKNEEQAWDLLKLFAEGGLDKNPDIEVEFDGWPNFGLTVKGERYQSSITTGMMGAYLEFQRNLNRARALGVYGVPDARHLTNEEVEEGDVVISVSPGSTVLKADIAPIVQSIASRVADISSVELIGIAVILGLTFCGATLIRHHFKTKSAVLEAERDKQITERSKEETKRMKILDNAYRRLDAKQIDFQQVNILAINSQVAILESIPDADTAMLGGVSFSNREINEIETPSSEEKFPVEISGDFEIRGLRTTYVDRYFLTLRRNGMRISASFDPSELDPKTIDRLKGAVIGRQKIRLKLMLTDRPYKQYRGYVKQFWPI